MNHQGNSPENPERPPVEDEIDLADLVGVLYRQRWLILVGTLLMTLLAAGYSLTKPEKYEVKSFLSVGKINGEYIEEPKAAASQIKSLAEVAAEKQNPNEKN